MPSDTFVPVLAEEVKALAYCLPTVKAPGPNGVPDVIVRAVTMTRAGEVACIFNRFLETGFFSPSWKVARLMLIRKLG